MATVTQDTVRGTFEDITANNPLPNAEYEVVLRDSNGNIAGTKFYNPRNANNGLIDFDFTGLNPNTDYNVQVRVTTDDGTFPLNSFNTRTQGESLYCIGCNKRPLKFYQEKHSLTQTASCIHAPAA